MAVAIVHAAYSKCLQEKGVYNETNQYGWYISSLIEDSRAGASSGKRNEQWLLDAWMVCVVECEMNNVISLGCRLGMSSSIQQEINTVKNDKAHILEGLDTTSETG